MTNNTVSAENRQSLPFTEENLAAIQDLASPLSLQNGRLLPGLQPGAPVSPACLPENLGDPAFCRAHGIKYAYVGGSMANGISSVELAIAFGRAGMLGFYGAAGQPLEAVEQAVDRLQASGLPFGVNLIHSPSEPATEAALVELFLKKGVRLVEASAYIALTLPLIRYRTAGISRAADGTIVTPNKVIGKISRTEVAARFFAPPEEKHLKELVARGELTAEQAELARLIPVAEDVTAEADSGGHTDNRPLVNLLPTILAQRDRVQAERNYAVPPRVGCGGGIATPEAAAAAFAMGAAYLVTGTVNQACVESGTSPLVRKLLAAAGQADVAMAAAADMFEMGVKVQILKRGTMFAMRANKLYELYKAYNSFDEIPEETRGQVEGWFKKPFAEVWAGTREFFLRRDPKQAERGEQDPKHKMALCFRWYLSQTSRWPLSGDESRKVDFQIWCGPGMGAFNEWARGTFLEQPEAREAALVARNLLAGAAALLRLQALRGQGVAADGRLARQAPRTAEQLKTLFR